MCAPGMIESLLSNRIAYPAATDADVPGREGSSVTLQGLYDRASLGFRVLVPNGNRYTKTSMTLYADGGRIQQEDAGGGAAGVDDTFSNLVPVAVGDLVYKTTVADTVGLAQADFTDTFAVGVVTAVVTASTCRVRMFGEAVVTSAAPYTINLPVYLSATTPGRGTQTPPTSGGYAQMLGIANTTTTVLLGTLPQLGAGILATNGSATAPSIALYNSPTTGFYRAAANTLGIAANALPIGTLSGTGLAIAINDASNATYSATAQVQVQHTTSGAPAAGIGACVELFAEGAARTVSVGLVGGRLLDVTSNAEIGAAEMLACFAGTRASAGFRVDGLGGSVGPVDCGLTTIPVPQSEAISTGIQVLPYSTDPAVANIKLVLGGIGTGPLELRSNIEMPGGTGASPVVLSTGTNNGLILRVNGNGQILLDPLTGTGGVVIGSSINSRAAFFGGTARVQQGAITNPAGGATVDAEARTAINSILSVLRTTTGFSLIAG